MTTLVSDQRQALWLSVFKDSLAALLGRHDDPCSQAIYAADKALEGFDKQFPRVAPAKTMYDSIVDGLLAPEEPVGKRGRDPKAVLEVIKGFRSDMLEIVKGQE